MREIGYNRETAVAYAHKWAYGRNPRYYNFDGIGGDCTNFASQVLYAGSGIMNYSGLLGWYYNNVDSRSPSWTGVEYLYNFLIRNKGVGPYAAVTDVWNMVPGDIIQLKFNGNTFQHSPVVVQTGIPASIDNILIAAHTFDADYRPINTYSYTDIRFIHILGVRK
jgi:hypothetical protein